MTNTKRSNAEIADERMRLSWCAKCDDFGWDTKDDPHFSDAKYRAEISEFQKKAFAAGYNAALREPITFSDAAVEAASKCSRGCRPDGKTNTLFMRRWNVELEGVAFRDRDDNDSRCPRSRDSRA